jgi:hypothetical protein
MVYLFYLCFDTNFFMNIRNLFFAISWTWLFVSISLLHTLGLCQVVMVSDEIGMSRDANYDLMGLYEGRVLLSKETSSDVTLYGFDQKMALTMEKNLTLGGKKNTIVGVIPGKQTIDVYFIRPLKERLSLHLIRFDGQGNPKDSFLIKEMPWIGIFPEFKITMSDNRNLSALHALNKEDQLMVFFIDLVDLELVAEHVYSVASLDFRGRFRHVMLSNLGELFIVLDNKSGFQRKEEYELTLILSGIDVAQPVLFPLRLGTIPLAKPHFRLDESNRRLVFAAPYTDRSGTETLGLAFTTFEVGSGMWEPFKTIGLDPGLLPTNRSGRKSRSEGIGDLFFEKMLVRQDGGIVAILEERREYERSLYQGRRDFYGMRFAIDYYYDDMYAIAVSPQGESHWQKRLPKKQYSFDDDALFSSFFIFETPSALRIVYNDEIKNENTVSEYVLTGGGLSERRNVLNTNRQDLRLQISQSLQVSSNEFVVPSVRRNRLKLVRIAYGN